MSFSHFRLKATSVKRRDVLKLACGFMILGVDSARALDIFKLLDPKDESKDMKKAKSIFQGASSILAGSTELDDKSERIIGESLALEGIKHYGLPIENNQLQKYVNLVGTAVARNGVRPLIPYQFVVIESPVYNAFSCPGGIVFISSVLMKAMADEAQLAGVLSHEVSHVGHKHALTSLKRAKFLEGVGKITAATMSEDKGKELQGIIGSLQEVLFDKGLDQQMEYEADLSGMETAYRSGYDPQGFIRVLEMLQTKEASARKQGSWFSTHPPLFSRIAKCTERMNRYPDASKMARVKNRFLQYGQQL
jgi:predicted Zn-dependent protease